MAQQHIHCTVDNCHYWTQGNKCQANEILVTSDSFGNQYTDRVDAGMSNQLSPTPVNSCMESCCKSFVPKDSPEIPQDGIKKQGM